MFRKVMRTLMRRVLGTIASYEVEGKENIPAEGPLLVVLNHLSFLDAPLILAGFPRSLEAIVLDHMLEIPVVGQWLRWYGVIPVKRDRFDRNVFRLGIAALHSGRALAVAPEAGVSDTGALVQARAGAAYLAVQAKAPVLPVAVTGTETVTGVWDTLAQNLSFRGLGHLAFWRSDRPKQQYRLTFGRPFNLEAAGQGWREKRKALRAATDEMMARIASLLPPQYQGFYQDTIGRFVSDDERGG